ncbi:hypothetical protein LCGC14_1186170 [marine sediment metagenome]|uniref:Polysaccharide biosynthesis protein C-terminal domain-containing protein n=1 Tax=marine sediment metagenome TaxID=412755 RepID=A0A0F9M8H9_9ZZZZ
MSPLIFFNIVRVLNSSIFIAFQKFKTWFYAELIGGLLYTIGLFLIYFLQLKNPLLWLTLLQVLIAIISCFFSILIVIPLIPSKKEENSETRHSYNKKFRSIHKSYGFYLMLAGMLLKIMTLTINFLFLNFGFIVFITFFTICENSVTSAQNLSGSNRGSYISVFSGIDYKKDRELFTNLFYQVCKYLTLLLCFITAVMFYYLEIYIIIIYSEIYLSIIIAVQIYLFTAFSRLILRNLMILTKSTKNTRIILYICIVIAIFNITITIISLLFFNFITYIILTVITSFFISIIYTYMVNKKIDLHLKLRIIYKPFAVFLISVLLSLIIIPFVNFQIFSNFSILNIIFNSTIRFFLFLCIFYIFLYLSKIITKEEYNKISKFLPILKSDKKFIRKINKFILYLLPSKRQTSK